MGVKRKCCGGFLSQDPKEYGLGAMLVLAGEAPPPARPRVCQDVRARRTHPKMPLRRDAERSSASGMASGTVIEGPGGRARLAAAVAVSTHEKTVGSLGGKRETNNETQAVYHTPRPRPQPRVAS